MAMRRPSVTATPRVTTASAIPSSPKGSSSSMPPERKAPASAPTSPRPARTRPRMACCPGRGSASLISQRRGAGFTGSMILARMFAFNLSPPLVHPNPVLPTSGSRRRLKWRLYSAPQCGLDAGGARSQAARVRDQRLTKSRRPCRSRGCVSPRKEVAPPVTPKTPAGTPALPPYTGISAKAYEHPADRAATAFLHRLPFFDPVVKKLLELTVERRMMQLLLGNSVRLGENQLPEIWRAPRGAQTTLGIRAVPTLP